MRTLTSDKYQYDVAWDAGHGSRTPGKRTPDGYKEHWINVRVAYYGMNYLQKRNLSVYKVGWDDTNAKDDPDESLSNRQKFVKKARCRVCVSTHANAHGSGKEYTKANGAETLVHNVVSKRKDSENLAMCNCSAMGVEAAVLVEIIAMIPDSAARQMFELMYLSEKKMTQRKVGDMLGYDQSSVSLKMKKYLKVS